MTFEQRTRDYVDRVERTLANALPDSNVAPFRLHEAMQYSVLGGGKRIRPLLVYATGEALDVDSELLDAPAAAIEMLHAFSLVHDDLPAMDNDALRRGKATTHIAFDQATAILAADALQPLAFHLVANSPELSAHPEARVRLVAILAEACGSNGMTGGQAIDMACHGNKVDAAELEHMYRLKTGRLLRASVLAAACLAPSTTMAARHALERFVDYLGLAFQIRDDMIDIEGSTDEIGKQQGADLLRGKATYPLLFGMDRARRRAEELLALAHDALPGMNGSVDGLRWLAQLIVHRKA